MKTLSDLKRDAKNGKIDAKMVLRFGDTNIPERLQGFRKVIDANTNSIKFLTNEGKISSLEINYASLVEYDTERLTIYNAGFRELNEEENNILKEWKKIADTKEYKERSENDMMSDGSSTYWQKKGFFDKRGFSYLTGGSSQNGLKFDTCKNMIQDKAIKGEIELQYELKARL
jgi:hypothetical protein